jgi:hypothetical protein
LPKKPKNKKVPPYPIIAWFLYKLYTSSRSFIGPWASS